MTNTTEETNDLKEFIEGLVGIVGSVVIGYIAAIGGGFIDPLHIAGGTIITDLVILSVLAVLIGGGMALLFAYVLAKYLLWRYSQRIYVADDGVLKELEEYR